MTFDVDFQEQNSDFSVDFNEQTVINTSKDILYTLSFDDFDGISTNDNLPILSKQVYKTTITNKGGVSCNIPAIRIVIYLWSAIQDLKTNNITKLVDIPFEYETSTGTLDKSSVKNACSFYPQLANSLFGERTFTPEYLQMLIKDYVTGASWTLISNSRTTDASKIMGVRFIMDLEFANENIQSAFFDEFGIVLNSMSHFCLKYQDMKEIECKYIGG